MTRDRKLVAGEKKLGRLFASDKLVEAIRAVFLHSPRKSVCKCDNQLQLKKTSVHKVLKKCLLVRL
jgi:hypothetical protein